MVAIVMTIGAEDTSVAERAALAPWLWVLIGLLLVAFVVAVVWGIVAWRRRRAAPARTGGPSLPRRLGRLWRPFYGRIPGRALHYPTIVVFGSAGAGKTHAIDSHVDWRGQANQFRASVDHDAALQLYLGPDVVVHEVSAPLLRDVSRGARRALQRLWRRIGPSATAVVVVDARTLLTTTPAALRELGQLVRGKIALFPPRCRPSLDIRVYLSHLDQIEGYEPFASAVGPEHEGLDLDRLGPDLSDVGGVVAIFDAHLAHALTTRRGEEFDRMVRFYAVLRDLVGGVRQLLWSVQGQDEPHAEQLRISGLYLGSLTPRSHVGKPFRVINNLVVDSIDRQHRRSLRGALAVMTAGTALVGSFAGWHLAWIRQAEEKIEVLEKRLEHDRESGETENRSLAAPTGDRDCTYIGAEPTPCKSIDISGAQKEAASELAASLRSMEASEHVWLAGAFGTRKRAILARFEEAIRESYLMPQIECAGRLRLLYIVSLLYATRDNELGRIVLDNKGLWARELKLYEWVIEYYVYASLDMEGIELPEPDVIRATGRGWSKYVGWLRGKMEESKWESDSSQPAPPSPQRETICTDDAWCLRERPPYLRSPHEYDVLRELQRIFRDMGVVPPPGKIRDNIIDRDLDFWSQEDYETLKALKEAVERNLPAVNGGSASLGLAELVARLSADPLEIERDFELSIDGEPVVIHGRELAALFDRSAATLLIEQVLGNMSEGRILDGTAFFGEEPPPAGVVRGYGGGPAETIAGFYTREAFERHVVPVLKFAARELGPESLSEASAQRRLTVTDAVRLEDTIRRAAGAYADAYVRELFDEYYLSFSFDDPSELTLPVVVKAFSRRSSWFVDFLSAVARNADPEIPDEEYFQPMAEALERFKPFVDLMREEDGAIPGLEPYQALLAGMLPMLSGAAGSPQATELGLRLSPLGRATLAALQGKGIDHEEQITTWLMESGLDVEWHAPFLAPVEAARELGIRNIESVVWRAWRDEVRPMLRPVLHAYPFDPFARTTVDSDELEALVRVQGKERGEFWATFDRLIGPATARVDGKLVMIPGIEEPPGMSRLLHDLERTSRILWDSEGARRPIRVLMLPQALPDQPHDGHMATMAYLRAGEDAVYGYNQRPEPQALELQWWNQGSSVVTLEMRTATTDAEPRIFTIEEDGPFSFYRLLDRGAKSRPQGDAIPLTRWCAPGESGGVRTVPLAWRVPLADGRTSRVVRMLLKSDPWLAFAVGECV